MLRESFELLDDQDFPAALLALQRTVVRAPPEKLPELEEQCRQTRGRELAELLAETRLAVGLADDGFQVKFVTPYEAGSFASLLETRQEELLKKKYSERSIQAWTDTPKEYNELQLDTRALVADARRLAGMIGVRIRFDPRLKDDRAERRRLIKLRTTVARLVAHVTALPGYTEQAGDHDNPDPIKDMAEQLRATSQPAPAGATDTPPP
ncbi:MAG: hypothetical protein ABIG44_02955 [Planctomycetota bacterium]